MGWRLLLAEDEDRIRKGDTSAHTGVKHAGGMFLARGRIHWLQDAAGWLWIAINIVRSNLWKMQIESLIC